MQYIFKSASYLVKAVKQNLTFNPNHLSVTCFCFRQKLTIQI